MTRHHGCVCSASFFRRQVHDRTARSFRKYRPRVSATWNRFFHGPPRAAIVFAETDRDVFLPRLDPDRPRSDRSRSREWAAKHRGEERSRDPKGKSNNTVLHRGSFFVRAARFNSDSPRLGSARLGLARRSRSRGALTTVARIDLALPLCYFHRRPETFSRAPAMERSARSR